MQQLRQPPGSSTEQRRSARGANLASTVQELATRIVAERRTPSATYRLQLNRAFTFGDAAAIVPYLYDLGVSDCYTSPLLKAHPQSMHGYDICDHSQLNPVLGGEAAFEAFSAVLRERGMGLLLDTVPNHMSIADASNVWWQDVLENGPSSPLAAFFDIDWLPVKTELRGRVLLPILEDQYGRVLESGKLRLTYEDGAFFVLYYETRLPVAPRSYTKPLSICLRDLSDRLGADHPQVLEVRSIMTALRYLPLPTERSPRKIAERRREKEIVKRRIAGVYAASPEGRAAIDAAVRAFNGDLGQPRSFDLLDDLLAGQPYRLAFWSVAADEINYRRFFDINHLAAIRMEVPEVFAATHDLILRLLAEGKVTGLRIDHPDGLWNPSAYLRQLQLAYLRRSVRERMAAEARPADIDAAVAAWFAAQYERVSSAPLAWPLYVVAEKILSQGETLSEEWAAYGTTGYEFANAVNGLFVDASNRRAIDAVYRGFMRERLDFRNLVNTTKKMIMLVALASEINVLSHDLNRISERHRWYRDFTLNGLTFAIREVIAALPVYRTYIGGPSGLLSRRDEAAIEAAVAEAKKRNPRTAEAIFDFIRDTLLLRNVEQFRKQDRQQLVRFVMKFQQLTGPVMAKGVEDTAFYVYNRLVSLNEVGGDPEQFGVSVAAFHRQNAERLRHWPHSLLATSTHDTKRSEDLRARIDVLSEMPREWRSALSRWGRWNDRKKTRVDGQPAPDRNDEYLLYQTLLGAWPPDSVGPAGLANFRERIAAYMLKATREAKVHTSWFNPNAAYDDAVRSFVLRLLPEEPGDRFLDDFRLFQKRVAYFGQFNALSQVLLKMTSPGVPDVYQGTELWDFSLVDPDNRRPVDYESRRSLLAELSAAVHRLAPDLRPLARELVDTSGDGRIKLYLTYRALNFRRQHQQLFASGAYLPLEIVGPKRDHLCAFGRSLGVEAVAAVVPRLVARLSGGTEQPPVGVQVWGHTWLALPKEWVGRTCRDLFTGTVLTADVRDGTPGLPAADVLADFPVALIERLA